MEQAIDKELARKSGTPHLVYGPFDNLNHRGSICGKAYASMLPPNRGKYFGYIIIHHAGIEALVAVNL